ncbi:tRNA preQ1(34) S-adenosylmethionine ribosyltransferase-isomerase QueA [Patescibacteria group bacterium]
MSTKAELFDYHLPGQLIAQEPVVPRDHSRLLVLDKDSGEIAHKKFFEIVEQFQSGDVLVMNNSKVFKARLRGQIRTKEVEVFLLRHLESGVWQAMIKPGKKVVPDDIIDLGGLKAVLIEKQEDGVVVLDLGVGVDEVLDFTEKNGEIPVPPYVKKQPAKFDNYQTVYAKDVGSVAAPTAGFHFTQNLIEQLKKKGVQFEFVTLHVGLGTFRPMKSEIIEEHQMHSEFVQIDSKTAQRINQAKQQGRRIIAVGTTTVRSLEGVAWYHSMKDKAQQQNTHAKETLASTGADCLLRVTSVLPEQGFSDDVNLFIKPGFEFKIVNALITNFHLPKSTLMVLVSALAGREKILKAYQEAVDQKYRFYSFGDAMFIK